MLKLTDNNELLAANINEMGRDAAAIKVIARMFNLRFDALWQRYEREQRRKRWIWIVVAMIIALLGLCIGGYFVQQNRTISKQKTQLENAANRLRADSLTLANHVLRIQNDSLQLVRKNDSIQKQKDSLLLTNILLADERNNVLIANWNMMENQSKVVAEKALSLVESNSFLARKLALAVLPKDLKRPDRPYTPEAERALRMACKYETAGLFGHTNTVCSAVYSPDGSEIVSASSDNTVRIWDSRTGECKHILSGHTSRVKSANYSPDGSEIVSASWDNTIRIWDSRTGECKHVLSGHDHHIGNYASYSPDGSEIVYTSSDNSIRIWEPAIDECKRVLTGHNDWVSSLNYSPDGSEIVSASGDSTIRIWYSRTGECKHVMAEQCVFVSYSPDGSYFVSVLNDKRIKVWNAKDGREVYSLVFPSQCDEAVFSSDSRMIALACSDGNIYLIDFPPLQELIDQTRERFKNNPLTEDEKRAYYLD